MEIIGFIAAIFIGISLGLIGGGGSILTVPVLVYLIGVEPVLATAYSLFIVGSASLVGMLQKYKQGLVSIKTAIVFAIPAFIAVYLTRYFIVPAIPDSIFTWGSFELSKNLAVMLFFALIMLTAAISMIRKKNALAEKEDEVIQFNYPKIIIEGAIVGLLTGLVGAGGGFLIIPALVLLAKLPMKMAVGTSLFIIAVKSLIGFVGDIQSGQEIDWLFLLSFTSCAIVGIFVGSYLSRFISGQKLKKGFGWFVLIMAVYILTKELLFQ
ncbi:MAG: putative membrane protein YfcA [Flavobacteriales bacterium]|jgi:uncharacterized membrane protein YfcA